MAMVRNLLLLGAALIALGACAKRTVPPGDVGVCYMVAGLNRADAV